MDLEGTKLIAADRATVWARLNDPAMLKAAIPGCTELTGTPEAGFTAVVMQKVGPVSATFRGVVQLTDVKVPESYRIVGEGKGGVAGFAKGSADVRLTQVADGTELTWKVEAHVGGKLAQLGSRVIVGFARKMADEFFERFAADTAPDAVPDAIPDAAPPR